MPIERLWTLFSPPERITFHVLESPDAAEAIMAFVCNNHVDHILMGARGSGGVRRGATTDADDVEDAETAE